MICRELLQVFINDEVMKDLLSSEHSKDTKAAFLDISTFSHTKIDKGDVQCLYHLGASADEPSTKSEGLVLGGNSQG